MINLFKPCFTLQGFCGIYNFTTGKLKAYDIKTGMSAKNQVYMKHSFKMNVD